MHPRAFVIHLARAKPRRGNVDAILASLAGSAEVFDAIDGRALSEAEVLQVYPGVPLMQPTYPFRIGRGEVACYLSHRAIWQRMVDQGIGQAIILEDDVQLTGEFGKAVDIAVRFAGAEGFVQFQTRPVRGRTRTILKEGSFRIVEPQIIPRRTSAQLLGINAARRLLQVSDRFDRPIDGVLQLRWETGQTIHCIEPSGVQDLTEAVGGTTIQSGGADGVGIKLRRAWNRGLYRAAVARRSRQTFGDIRS